MFIKLAYMTTKKIYVIYVIKMVKMNETFFILEI